MAQIFITAGFEVNTLQHTIYRENETTKVRPKTFALLCQFLEHPGETLSKTTLLESVWNDVVVDEQVLFQSVRELRQLFNNPDIIKTHPRKGYSWTEDVSQPASKPLKNHLLHGYLKHWIFASAALALVAIFALTYLSHTTDKTTEASGSIIVLPMKTTKPSNELDWVYLGAMDQLIYTLQRSGERTVMNTEDVLAMMGKADLSRRYTSQRAKRIFSVTEARVLVETELSGFLNEFELTYTLHLRDSQKRGLILANTVDEAILTLANKIAVLTGTAPENSLGNYQSDFSSEIMANALEHLRSRDLETAGHLFASVMEMQPTNLTAYRKYAESKFYNREYEAGREALQKAIQIATQLETRDTGRLYYWLALFDYIEQKPGEALTKLDIAEPNSKKFEDQIYLAFITELRGLLSWILKQPEAAIGFYQQAISYYGIMHCPIGRSRVRLELAKIYHGRGELERSNEEMQKVKHLVDTYELSGIKPRYDLAKNQISNY